MSLSNVARASRRGFLAAVALSALAAFPATAQTLVEGQHYTRIKNPQPVGSGKKIEVLEFFSYGCPHCRDLDPELVAWQKSIPADVEFRRVPVDYGREQWAVLAKAYYTLEALGVEEKLTPEVFAALHDKKAPLYQDKAFFDWAATKGLDRKKVEDAYNSFGVTSKFNRSRAIAKDYNVQSVPLVIVDGRVVPPADAAAPFVIHRMLGLAVAVVTLVLAYALRRSHARAAVVLMALALAAPLLGVTAILALPSLSLTVSHNAVSAALIAALAWVSADTGGRYRLPVPG